MSNLPNELKVAIAAVRDAAVVCQAVQRRLVTSDTLEKKDRSPVTVADFASQAIVLDRLANAFPDDAVVGEEDAGELREPAQAELRKVVVEEAVKVLTDADESHVLDMIDRGNADGSTSRYWTLDPIDGTKGFLRGEQYAIALALIEDGQVVFGVLGCPNLPLKCGVDTQGAIDRGEPVGTLLYAGRGMGCHSLALDGRTTQGTQVHVSDIAQTSDACFCESVESGHSSHGDSAQVAELLGITRESVRLDSQCKYAVIARGDASIYLRLPTRPGYREKIWDHAAGMICVEEAGGRVSDVAGKTLDYSHGAKFEMNRGVIGTSGPIHDAVVEAVGKVLGDRTHSD